jgi:hypothetical protein
MLRFLFCYKTESCDLRIKMLVKYLRVGHPQASQNFSPKKYSYENFGSNVSLINIIKQMELGC